MIKQLYLTVKGLCNTVASLTSKFDTLLEAQRQGTVQGSSPTSTSRNPGGEMAAPGAGAPWQQGRQDGEYRTMIRQEVQELREREKERIQS